MLLSGKNAVVTGCKQGIGRSTFEQFAKNGANIWACAISYDEEFEHDCRRLSKANNAKQLRKTFLTYFVARPKVRFLNRKSFFTFKMF